MANPPKLIVAIDFGTTYSGFSYAHLHAAKADPQKFVNKVQGFEQWPEQAKAGAKPYSKTQTSLLYVQKGSSTPIQYELKAWGWSAFHQHKNLLQASRDGKLDTKSFQFITKFKLALAGSNAYGVHSSSYKLPAGFTVQRVVTDYLHELSILVEKELRNKYGKQISKNDIQWCLTVPAIWDDSAKQQMKECAERAGLVTGPLNVHPGEASPHPIVIVLEPEAASVYSLHQLREIEGTDLPAGSKILIVDAGGGTVDLVFQETVKSDASNKQVKEISGSSGGLCGATVVDEAFFQLLSKKINCYETFIKDHPSSISGIKRDWEDLRDGFDGSPGPYEMRLPAKLAAYWDKHDRRNGLNQLESVYDDVKITLEEMRAVFDSAINKILKLIDEQLGQVTSTRVDALMVVGGFSASEYLMGQIRKQFGGSVDRIINPPNSGRAVVTGAVAFAGLGNIVVSRISRKTYGKSVCFPFRDGIDPISLLEHNEKGHGLCGSRFDVFVRKGDEVAVNSCLKRKLRPLRRSFKTMEISICSTTNTDPSYITDFDVVKECTYSFPLPSKADMDEVPLVEISIYFGLTSIQVTTLPLNFKSETGILPVVTSFDSEALPVIS